MGVTRDWDVRHQQNPKRFFPQQWHALVEDFVSGKAVALRWALLIAVLLLMVSAAGYYIYWDNQAKQVASMTATANVNAAAVTATQSALRADSATATQSAFNVSATQVAANATATQFALNADFATATQVATNATATSIAVDAATRTAANAVATKIAVDAINARASRYSGSWTKEKAAPVGVSALAISANGANLNVHAWSDVRDILGGGGAAQGICTPSDCDWGTQTVSYKSDPLPVMFTVGSASYELTIAVTADLDSLFLNQTTKIGTSTFRTAINFHRVKLIIDPVFRIPPCRLQGTC